LLTPCLACKVATYCTRLVHCFLVLLPSFTCRAAVALPVVTLPRLHSSQGLRSSQPAASRQNAAVIFSDPAVSLQSVPKLDAPPLKQEGCRLRLKCDGTRAETRFRLSAKRTSPFKSAGASVQSTIGSRGVHISGSNAGYTMFLGNVKGTGYPLHSPVSLSLPLPCVTVCHHISTGLYISIYLVSG
jgi:hypothetical protein